MLLIISDEWFKPGSVFCIHFVMNHVQKIIQELLHFHCTEIQIIFKKLSYLSARSAVLNQLIKNQLHGWYHGYISEIRFTLWLSVLLTKHYEKNDLKLS